MKLRFKTVLLTLLAIGSMCLFTACGSEKTPYDVNNEENFTVSVKFDANGGVFTTNTTVIVDSYNVSSMKADEDGYVDIKGDRKRGIDAIIENSDVVCYLEPRPLDVETGRPGLSKAHFFAGEDFFARSRYIDMIPSLDVFTAEGFTKAVYDGVVAEAKRQGADLVDPKKRLAVKQEQQGGFELSFNDCKEQVLDMMDELDDSERGDEVDDILLRHFASPDEFNNIKESQFETLQSIYHALKDKLED